jgi:hypothetical protein
MKILFSGLLILFTFYSCSKEEIKEFRELNITYKSSESFELAEKDPQVNIYPNPFNNYVCFELSGVGEILIADQSGGMKKIITQDNLLMLDFSKEKSGTYYCEVYLNGIVFRMHLIKI